MLSSFPCLCLWAGNFPVQNLITFICFIYLFIHSFAYITISSMLTFVYVFHVWGTYLYGQGVSTHVCECMCRLKVDMGCSLWLLIHLGKSFQMNRELMEHGELVRLVRLLQPFPVTSVCMLEHLQPHSHSRCVEARDLNSVPHTCVVMLYLLSRLTSSCITFLTLWL